FCPLHKVKLQETIIPRHPKNQHEYIPASPDVKRKDVNLKGLTEDDINNLIEIAQMTEKLLITRYHQSTNNTLRMRYLNELRQRGYASISGFLKREKLYQSFQSRFSKSFLASV